MCSQKSARKRHPDELTFIGFCLSVPAPKIYQRAQAGRQAQPVGGDDQRGNLVVYEPDKNRSRRHSQDADEE